MIYEKNSTCKDLFFTKYHTTGPFSKDMAHMIQMPDDKDNNHSLSGQHDYNLPGADKGLNKT